MGTHPPKDRIPALEACAEDLRTLAAKMRKEKAIGIYVGTVLDNICALELVIKYGSYGGKVPYPVSEPSLSVFKKHGIEDFIHPPWQPRHRPSKIEPLTTPLSTPRPKKKYSFTEKLDHWIKLIEDRPTLSLTGVTRAELRKALPVYRSDKGLVYWKKFMREEGGYRYWLESDDVVGLALVVERLR